METVEVKTMLVERMPAPIAKQLIEDFCEWVEEQGLHLIPKPSAAEVADERGYDELAEAFLIEYS